MESHEPPLQETYKTLLQGSKGDSDDELVTSSSAIIDQDYCCDLPTINLSRLSSNEEIERENCMHEIARAAIEWGFFQVVNHGVSEEVLLSLENEQKKLFNEPFKKKIDDLLNLSPIAYRWGNSKATCANQLSWSEAFHLSIGDIPSMKERQNLRLTMERFVKIASEIVQTLTKILLQNLGSIVKPTYFKENCPPSSSYLRLNRYPPCPFSSSAVVFGLIPHTDSDIISVVHQDQIGGLQLLRDGKWIGVKPNPEALIINIGDLFQAISNGLYKSVKHRVVATESERFSLAYFYCPTDEAIVESFTESPPVYRKFSFREYKEQNQKDVKETGDKIGLQRFLL